MIKNRPPFEKIYPYAVAFFIGYLIADVSILAIRGKMIPNQPPPSKPAIPMVENVLPRSQYNPITSRNFFSPDGTMPPALAGDPKQVKELPPVPSQLPLTLVGTIVHSNPDKSVANIELKSKNLVFAVRVGNAIENIASLVSVERQKVIIRNNNNGRLEFIEMKINQSKISFSTASMAPGKAAGEIQQTAPNVFEIKKSDLQKYTSDLNSILQQAAMVPKRNADGEIECFKFLSIQPGSIYTQLGLRVGDCINSVNGQKVTNPQEAMNMYKQLMSGSSAISLGFERDGRQNNNDYNIKQ